MRLCIHAAKPGQNRLVEVDILTNVFRSELKLKSDHMKCYIHDILHVGKGCELPLPLDMVTNLAVFTVKMGGWGVKIPVLGEY